MSSFHNSTSKVQKTHLNFMIRKTRTTVWYSVTDPYKLITQLIGAERTALAWWERAWALSLAWAP